MPKSFLYLVAALALLLAALVLGQQPAPRGHEPRVVATTRPTAHARSTAHGMSHDRTAIDDDDESDDDDEVELAMLAPQQHQIDVASDAASDEPSTSTTRSPFTMTAASLRVTGRGIRPSGEHRSAADRPPRS